MSIHPLPDDSPLSQEILPSVWTGYRKPPCRPIKEAVDQTSQMLQIGYNISNEEANRISNCFWTDSIHDFCVHYLREKLTEEDHAKILKTANEFIKNGTIIKIDENEKDLNKLLAAKVVLNAHQRANHAMSNACFLNEHDRLPKENIFMLQKGISPIFYEKDEFDRSEILKKQAYDVSEDLLLGSFDRWIRHGGIYYIPIFKQMQELLRGMKYMNALILKESMRSYMSEKRKIERHSHRSHPGRRSWRGYGE